MVVAGNLYLLFLFFPSVPRAFFVSLVLILFYHKGHKGRTKSTRVFGLRVICVCCSYSFPSVLSAFVVSLVLNLFFTTKDTKFSQRAQGFWYYHSKDPLITLLTPFLNSVVLKLINSPSLQSESFK